MKATRIAVASVLGVLVLGGVISSLFLFNQETRNYDEHKTVEGEKVASVQISTSSTDVNLLKSNDDQIHVDFTGQVKNGGFGGGDYQVNTALSGDVLKVEVEREWSFQIGFTNERNLRLDVRLPEKVFNELAVSTSSGDIEAKGLKAETVVLRSSSGDIQGGDIQGKSLKFRTSSGDMLLQNLIGRLYAETSSGEVGLRKWTGESLEAESSSGNLLMSDLTGKVKANSSSGELRIGMSALQENIDLSTSSGNVEVRLPSNSYMKLNFRSSSGEANVEFPMQISRQEKGSFIAEIGTGGPSVRVDTSSGDLRVIQD